MGALLSSSLKRFSVLSSVVMHYQMSVKLIFFPKIPLVFNCIKNTKLHDSHWQLI